MNTARFTLDLWACGLITISEAIDALETIEVYGAFGDGGFTGYDYINQCWVTS